MEIDLKQRGRPLPDIFRHRWALITLVAMIWTTAIVTVYVISSLRPWLYQKW